ncbi:hypothetical protein Cylst_2933 [Cylindrospermum stagnale PCC 7417]|uniref:Uncharacterized protein n=1 Tax=Cylindrospermum stagnale PCC 7417 TaxID=56107 RepID=K9WXM3_9NOST|nr:hypothetical protein Cylst_2933 [Cylindrospermum stagnale PCC 7417]
MMFIIGEIKPKSYMGADLEQLVIFEQVAFKTTQIFASQIN